MAERLTSINERRLLLCEGFSDRAFFKALLANRAIDGFQVVCPQSLLADGGVTRFSETLNGLFPIPGFEQVQTILVVVDSDSDPTASFEEARQQVQDTEPFGTPSKKLAAPNAVLQIWGGPPSVSIMLTPWHTVQGTLENLCWEVGKDTNPALGHCVEDYVACANAVTWPPSKLGKLKLRCLLAATYQKNPDLSLTFVWDDVPHAVPLGNPRFDQIADRLRWIRNNT